MTHRESTVAPILQARLFGRVSLSVGERVVEDDRWPPRGGRALLLLLLATPGHRLSRERVLDALWPDLPPEAARNAYYKALHSLRRTLEPELPIRQPGRFIVATAETLALTPGSCVVDVDMFERTLVEVKAAPDAVRAGLLRAALDLYRGELLVEESDLEWADERRNAARCAWQEASLQLAELDLAQGRLDQAISLTQAIVAAEATNEAAHRLLIRAFERNGQRDLAWRQYERCVEVLRDELGIDPSTETRRVGASVLGASALDWPVFERSRRRWANLPAPPTLLLGREQEIESLQTLLLRDGARLLTLTGAGGVGKTRLALETAAQLADEFEGGVCFVPLAPIRDPGLVLPSIAQALGPRDERGGPTRDQVIAVLQDRSVLLVIDNFEHVREAAPVVADILAACSGVRVLVTSREPLHLRAERLVLVPPLDLPEYRAGAMSPPSLAQLARSPAVALFLERAAAVSPGFALAAANAADIVRICARLDGLPLAIELAAARIREYPPDRLLELLDDRLGTLVEGFQDLPPRQRAMRDTIAWSHDLLPANQQLLFRRLAVCAGGCTAELAAGLADLSVSDAEAGMESLIDKSLMHWQRNGGRAGMLETTREFGLDRLEAEAETAFARAFLVTFALELTTAAADHLAGEEQGSWLDRLDADLDNLREALAWTIERGETDRALALTGNLWRYWWSRGHLSEGRMWLERVLALPGGGDPSPRGFAINGAASLAESQGDFARAEALHSEALVLWQEQASPVGEARALTGLGTVAAHRGDYAHARSFHERALSLARQAGDTAGAARTLDRLGTVARHQGELTRAEAAYAESLTLFRQTGDMVNVSIVLSNLGEVLQRHGHAERAAEHFEEALRLERELDLPDGIAYDLTNLARVRLDLGEVDRAAALSAQGLRLFREMGNQLGLASALAVRGLVSHARGNLAEAQQFVSESLRALAELNEQSAIPEHLEQLAAIMLDAGNGERAVRLLGAASALRERLISPPTPLERATTERFLANARATLGDHLASQAFVAGRALSLDRALKEAFEDSPVL